MRVRARAWAGILAAYFSSQTLVQLLGIGAGLLFINFMSVTEFALYSLASSVVTFFTFASDLGATSSLLHFYRESAQSGESFAPWQAAVSSLRRAAFVVGAVAVTAALPAMATARGFSLGQAAAVTAGVLLGVWFQIGGSLRLLALRLADRYGVSYRAEVAGAGLRLVLALALVATARATAWLGVLSGACGTALTARLAGKDGGTAAGVDLRPYRRRVLRYLAPTLPSALYFSVRGPLVIWLAATFGSTRSIAEVGALGRLGLVVGLFAGLTGIVFLPRLARIVDDRLYRIRYLQFGAALALVAAGILAAAAVAPRWFLMVLGPNYHGLEFELLLVVAGSGLSLLDGYAVAVNNARSWTRWQAPALLLLVAVQATLVAVLPLATTSGVLLFNLGTAAVGLAVQLAIGLVGFVRPGLVRWA